jgi:hypothetical protein
MKIVPLNFLRVRLEHYDFFKKIFGDLKILRSQKKIEIIFLITFIGTINSDSRLLVKMSASNFNSTSGSSDMSGPSLCIPRVFANITDKRVAFVIREVGLGEIDHIDMVPKTAEDGTKFQRVFIHFKKWNSSEAAQRARERVLSGKEIKIVYDDPWFWKLSVNRAVQRPPREEGVKQRPQQRPRPRLVDDEPLDQALRLQKQQRQQRPRNADGERPTKVIVGLREPSPCAEAGEVFDPVSPIGPPPPVKGALDVDAPAEQAWVKVEYGNLLPPKKKTKRVAKDPLKDN